MEGIERRSEYVGKRVATSDLKKKEYSELDKFNWKCGIIRCVASNDIKSSDFLLYVEWDNEPWQDREWISRDDYLIFFIEQSIVTITHPLHENVEPALMYTSCKGDIISSQHVLIEFLKDRCRIVCKESSITEATKEKELTELPSVLADNFLYDSVIDWVNLQRTQKALLQSTHSLVGTRVLVYWNSSSVQWISALITGQDGQGKLQIMTEQVLTKITVDPAETQVQFIDKNTVDDILSGDSSKLARRSRRSTRFNSSSANEISQQVTSRRRSSKGRKSSLARDLSSDTKTSDPECGQPISSKPDAEIIPSSSSSLTDHLPCSPPSTSITTSTILTEPSGSNKEATCDEERMKISEETVKSPLPQLSPSVHIELRETTDSIASSEHQSSCLESDDTVLNAANSLLCIASKYKSDNKSVNCCIREPTCVQQPINHLKRDEFPASSPQANKMLKVKTGPLQRTINMLHEKHASSAIKASTPIHVPTPIMLSKPRDMSAVISSPIVTSLSSFVPNSQSGSFEAYKKKGDSSNKDNNTNLTENRHLPVHSSDYNLGSSMTNQSQHARALSEIAAAQQQVYLRQQQQQQQQQPQLGIPAQQQFLASPFLNNPYGLQLFYSNPAMAVAANGFNASAMAQAAQVRMQAAAAVARTLQPPFINPFIKTPQQEQLEKEMQLNQQQQALYTLTYLRGMPEAIPAAYAGLYQEAASGRNSSPKPPHPQQSSPGKELIKGHPDSFKVEKTREARHSPKTSMPRPTSHSPSKPSSRRPLDAMPERNAMPLPRSHPYPHPSERSGLSPHRAEMPYAKHSLPHDLILKERELLIRRQEEEKRRLEELQNLKLQEHEENAKREEEECLKAQRAAAVSEENRKAMIEKNRKAEHAAAVQMLRSEKISMVKHPHMWSGEHGMPHSALGMLDPATFVAANAARFINEEAVQKNGLMEKERLEMRRSPPEIPQASHKRYVTPDMQRQKTTSSAAVSPGQTVASSSKIWQPPVMDGPKPSVNNKDKRKAVSPQSSGYKISHQQQAETVSSALPVPASAPYPAYPYLSYMMPDQSAGLGKSIATHPSSQAGVFNINSLKYSPSNQLNSQPSRSDVLSKSSAEKNVVVKPTPAYRDSQSIKYISDRNSIKPKTYKRSPSPEKLGPLMPDGSRAKILSQASLSSLYQFPKPSTKSSARLSSEKVSNPVIINGGHYKVTEVVHGGQDAVGNEVTTSTPTHVVYPKPNTVGAGENELKAVSIKSSDVKPVNTTEVKMEPSPNEEPEAFVNKNVRKRTNIESELVSVHKKACPDKETRTVMSSHSNAPYRPPPLHKRNHSNLNMSSPHLQGLAAAGLFAMDGLNITWGDSSTIDKHYLGAPSKLALKDALLKNEPLSNFTSSKSVLPPYATTKIKDQTSHRRSPKPQNGETSMIPPTVSHSTLLDSSSNASSINYTFHNSKPTINTRLMNGNREPPPTIACNDRTTPPDSECKIEQKPSDLSINAPKEENPAPHSVSKTVTTMEMDSKPKTPNSGPGSAVSPGSDASSISDFSWGSNSSKGSVRPSSGDGIPPVSKPPCPKLKKAWLKRMSDESDDATKSPAAVVKPIKRKNSSDRTNSPVPSNTIAAPRNNKVEEEEKEKNSDDMLAPPVKKPKKKHRNKDKEKKDANKSKKRKHKDKDGKKQRKSESSPSYEMQEQSGASSPATSSAPETADDGMKDEHSDKEMMKTVSKAKPLKQKNQCIASNSKNFLLGRPLQPQTLNHDEDAIEGEGENESGDGKKNKKKKVKEPPQMPVGENGLPMSVLLCRKEQARLKRTCEPFMQDAACHEISALPGITIPTSSNGASSLPKCRECRSAKRKENNAIFCRFYGFRKLAFVNGQLQAAGFCDPEDSRASDLSLWLPALHRDVQDSEVDRAPLDLEACKYIMRHIGGKFCELVQEEREAITKAEETTKVSWKRPVAGVREMCDACETTLFNLHWVCQKCGFGVCSDCYKIRQAMSREELEAYDGDKNNLQRWLRCTKGKHHLPSHLIPTQIIPSTCLFDLCELAHDARAQWSIKSQCRCKKSAKLTQSMLAPRSSDPTPLLKNHCNSELLSHHSAKPPPTVTGNTKGELNANRGESNRLKGYDCESSASPLDWLASIALHEQRKSSAPTPPTATSSTKSVTSGSEESCQNIKISKELTTVTNCTPALLNTALLPSSSHAPRTWLCNGQLLQLTDCKSTVNIDSFQLHWFYGMPVMASGASSSLTHDLWKPERFTDEHGEQPTGNALVNCRKGSIITNAFIKDFWCGFESIENRLEDEKTGEKMILKLKDWPTADDFIDTMPDRFDDLMRALPLPQYTARDGIFNIAAQLPDFFVRPDLGPKMYIAYGWVSEKDWTQGTTNLHLDISDACNLMVYVGIPEDEPPGAMDTLIKIIKEGDADEAQVERVKHNKPGALWHIFKASDTDKIRKLILKVRAEQGIEVSDDHDPIHDQQIYLDQRLRRRLREEYGVESYPIVQCEGDSVFIPAGAPHQVFNLHSCIKVAEDFVSPEHVDKCFKLMEEFRYLSTTHSNHEDKLQLKNIIYHAMKEVLSALSWYESKNVCNESKSLCSGDEV